MAEREPVIEIGGEIGAGATGRVLRGELKEPFESWPAGTKVAVKVLHENLRGDARARERFRNEALAAEKARHPGLSRMLHFGESAEGPRIVMVYVAGETLGRALESRGPIPEPQLRVVAAQIAGGLAALHAKGWIHNDVKLENMRWDGLGHAVLLDLGFARKVSKSTRESKELDLADADGVNPGSLPYLAPERARGETANPKSDVFALGVALYQLATGRHPFLHDEADRSSGGASRRETGFSSGALLGKSIDAPGADRLIAAMATARYVPPSRIVPQLSPFLDQLLEELLRRDPADRPTAAEVAERFESQESGEWWRNQLDLSAGSRRGVMGAPDASHFLPLVGRDAELDRLRAIYREVVGSAELAGVGRAVWIRGVFGSGKSRLVSDFAAEARKSESPPLYLYARCTTEDDARPTAAVLRLLQRYLQLPPGAAPTERERAWLGRIVPPKEAIALARALDPTLEGSTDIALGAALSRWLATLGRGAPMLVFLDDLNFASEGTLDVLARLSDELAKTRILLLLGWREEEEAVAPELVAQLRERLKTRGRDDEIRLGPIDQGAIESLVMHLFHHTAPRLRIAEVLFARSRGSPGLVGEILRGLVEHGGMQPYSREDPRFVLTIAPDDLPLPESLQHMIRDRYQKLPPEDRSWLGRLAVVGGRIDAAFLVRAFQPATRLEIDGVLSRLVRAGWLVPAGARYRFARPALREAVYRALSATRKKHLHALAAGALAPQRGKAIAIEDAYQRAFHLRAAEEHAALLRLLTPLIDALVRRGQPQRILSLARWGLEALDSLPHTRPRDHQRIRFLEAAADAADRLGQRADQRQWLDQLSSLEIAAEEDPEALARVYLLHGRYAVSTGQYGLARGMLRNSVELARRHGAAPELESEALRRLSAVQAHVGELGEARRLANEALASAVHDPQRAVSWLAIGTIDLLEDELEDALRAAQRSLAHMRRAEDWRLPGVFAAAYMLRGRTYRLAGMVRRAIGSMDRAVRLAQQAGERRLEMETTARLGGLLLEANRPDDAEARLRDALLLANEIEDRRGQTLTGLWLAILLWERLDAEAERVLLRVTTLANEMRLSRAEAMARAIQARIHHQRGRGELALVESQLAMELLERSGAELADRIVISGTRAMVLEANRQPGPAREIVKELRARMRRENKRLRAPALRRSQRVASTRLLEEVLTLEGVIYPRVELGGAPEPATSE